MPVRILSQKGERPIKVLFGELQAYWEKAEMGAPVQAVPLTPSVQPAASVAPVSQPSVPTAPAKPTKKNAGC